MLRPRRSTTLKTYVTHSSDEEMEAQIEGSNFDSLSEESGLSDGSNDGISESEGSGVNPVKDSPEIPNSLPLFPLILTEPQMIHTRALVTDQVATLAQLKTAYEEHMIVAQELESKIDKTEEALFNNKAKLSTLNRIPPEILGVIFTAHVRDNDQSPWLLMQISRVWRATALLTRVLWRGIMLVPRIERFGAELAEGGAIRRTREGMEICSSKSLVLSAIKRAGSCPLDLKITVSRTRHTVNPTREEAELLELIEVILKVQKTPRVKSLQVITNGQFVFPLDTFNQFSFAEMESAVFDGDYYTVVDRLEYEAPLLHKLHIISTNLESLRDFSRWDKIDELSVERNEEDVEVDIEFILQQAANITSLKLIGDLLEPSSYNDCGTPELPSLTRMFFQETSDLFSIKYPNVTHLTITFLPEWTGPSPQERSVVLPRLMEVECTMWEGCIGILCAIHAPSLQTLILEASVAKAANARGFKKLWPTQSAVARAKSPSGFLPTVLHLKTVWIAAKAWGRIFAEQTALEECQIENGDITAAFFEALTPVKSARSNGSKGRGKNGPANAVWKVECPKLRKMIVDCSYFVVPDQSLKESAQIFVAQRVEAGAPLEQLSIKLSGDTKWEDLVA